MKYKGREVKMIDVNPDNEDVTLLSDDGWSRTIPAKEIVPDVGTGSAEGEERTEFERLLLLRQCLSVVVGSIKPTDGPEGSLLSKVRETILKHKSE